MLDLVELLKRLDDFSINVRDEAKIAEILYSHPNIEFKKYFEGVKQLASKTVAFKSLKILIIYIGILKDAPKTSLGQILLEIIKASGNCSNLGAAIAGMKGIVKYNLLAQYLSDVDRIWTGCTDKEQRGIAMSFHEFPRISECLETIKKIFYKTNHIRVKLSLCGSLTSSGDAIGNKEALKLSYTFLDQLSKMSGLDDISKGKVTRNKQRIALSYPEVV